MSSVSISYFYFANPEKLFLLNQKTFKKDKKYIMELIQTFTREFPEHSTVIKKLIQEVYDFFEEIERMHTIELAKTHQYANFIQQSIIKRNQIVGELKRNIFQYSEKESVRKRKELLLLLENHDILFSEEEKKKWKKEIFSKSNIQQLKILEENIFKWIEEKKKINQIQKQIGKKNVVSIQEILEKKEKEELRKKISEIKTEIELYEQRLKEINQDIYRDFKSRFFEELKQNEKDRLTMILTDLKLIYEKALQTEFYRKELEELYPNIELEPLKNQIQILIQQKEISEKDYNQFLQEKERIEKEFQKKKDQEKKYLLAKVLKDELQKFGYSVQTYYESETIKKLQRGEIIYFDSKYGSEYKVQLKLDEKNQIIIRFVRFVLKNHSFNDYDKQKDLEIAKLWCKDYEEIRNLLKREGIYLYYKYREEPNLSSIFYQEVEDVSFFKTSKKIKDTHHHENMSE